METVLECEKRLARMTGRCAFGSGAQVGGYEIHMGRSVGPGLERPAFLLESGRDGARSADGQILGTYLHGLFDTPSALSALLEWAGLRSGSVVDLHDLRERSLDRIADAAAPVLSALRRLAPGWPHDTSR